MEPAAAPGLVRFFEDEAPLIESVIRFLGEGLASGQPLLVIATEAHRAAFRRGLEALGLDTGAAAERGRFVLLDARETLSDFMVGDLPDWRRFNERVGGQLERLVDGRAARARVYGEMADLLWRDGNRQGAIHLEEMWNEVAKATSSSVYRAFIVDRQDYEDALRQAFAEARRVDRRKDEFLAILGHELRNPLAPMLTALQLMKARGERSCERERVVLERQLRHIVQLVDDLLDVSRVARGKVELHQEPLEIAAVVARAVEMTSPLFTDKRHRLTVRIPKRGLAVGADATRLAQVFANLLTNAAKYTDARGRVEIAGTRDERAVEITIRDSGIGIAPDVLPHVFDLFVQADHTRARTRGGLGLGLTIVRTIVQLHGGTVTAHSEGLGRGSTFVVRLPAVATPVRRAPVTSIRQAEKRRLRRTGRGLRVLVVDDHVDAGEMIAEGLRLLGHDARVAGDGVTALALAASFAPETVVLDLGLPGALDGYAVAVRLRQAGRPLRIVAFTGYGSEDDRWRSAAAGIDAHLVKPVEFEVLAAAVIGDAR